MSIGIYCLAVCICSGAILISSCQWPAKDKAQYGTPKQKKSETTGPSESKKPAPPTKNGPVTENQEEPILQDFQTDQATEEE